MRKHHVEQLTFSMVLSVAEKSSPARPALLSTVSLLWINGLCHNRLIIPETPAIISLLPDEVVHRFSGDQVVDDNAVLLSYSVCSVLCLHQNLHNNTTTIDQQVISWKCIVLFSLKSITCTFDM